jgi:nitrogen fixation NifU-like protein
MNDNLYREIILEHWKEPQNYGVLKHADIDVTDLNPFCGDQIHITAKVAAEKIAAIQFEAEGCAISKASASLFTEEVKGKPMKEILEMTPQEVLELLEIDLTPTRQKCALLVYSVLKKGIIHYQP